MSYVIAFIAGIVTSLPLIFEELSPIAWLSAAPLFYYALTKKSAYRHGLAFCAGYYGLMYHWFIYLYPLDFAGFTPAAAVGVILVAIIGMTLLQSVTTALVPFILNKIKTKNSLIIILSSASLWTLAEWLQTQTWMGVPWGRLAVTQYAALPAIQSASLFGSLFVCFLMAAVNACVAVAFLSLKQNGKLHSAAFAGVAVLVLNYLFGTAVLLCGNNGSGEETVSVALIQGNVLSGEKWEDNSVEASLELYTSLTTEACSESGAEIVLWPETVITTSVRKYSYLSDSISELSMRTGAVVIVGCFDYQRKDGDWLAYNSLIAFYPDGTVSENSYNKRHPVPFGEYLPSPDFFETVLPVLTEMNIFSSDISAGDSTELLYTEYGNIGSLICFDSIYETLALDSVRDGAGILAISTNDSWYYDSSAVSQHNGHAVLRAVENGRYVIRAANTGISSIITPSGEISASLGALKRGYVTGEVEFLNTETLYTKVGNIIVPVSGAFVIFSFVFSFFERKQKPKHTVGSRG